VNGVVCSPDEHHFVTCGADGSVRVWALPSNELLVQFQVLNQSCECVCWSPTVGHVAGGYSDGSVRIFSIVSAEMEFKLQPPHRGPVSALQYSHHVGKWSDEGSVVYTINPSIAILFFHITLN
ncbi:WD repeat-containing protein 90, partial [Tachysurus ichikawai]